MVRFIHSADLHLDQPFSNIRGGNNRLFAKLSEATYTAFERLIDTALEEAVDFVLFVGDSFEKNPPSLKAQLAFRQGMERLNKADIQVLMSYGNHDYVEDEKYRLSLPHNVHIFPKQRLTTLKVTTKQKETVVVSGFSYGSRFENTDWLGQYPHRLSEYDFHIGLLHGQLAGSGVEHYAPFSLDKMKGLAYDYWALGHIHKRQMLSSDPPIVYAGNIQGHSFKESGTKGALLVELMKGEPANIAFFKTSEYEFSSPTVDLGMIRSLEDLHDRIERSLHEEVMAARNSHTHRLVKLQFTSDGDIESLRWFEDYHVHLLTEFQRSLSRQMDYQKEEVYLLALTLDLAPASLSTNRGFGSSVECALEALDEKESFRALAEEVVMHPFYQQFLSPKVSLDALRTQAIQRARQILAAEHL